ncbi:unnamed protein product [Sympodiomycopsis kandeliae]
MATKAAATRARTWTSASGCSSFWSKALLAHPSTRATTHSSYFHTSHCPSKSPNDGSSSSASSSSSSSPKHSSTTSSSSSQRSHSESDSDSALGFGGGASSRGGPSEREPLILGQQDQSRNQSRPVSDDSSSRTAAQDNNSPHPSTTNSTPRRQQPVYTISGSAGKGAVPGYGQRKRGQDLPDQSRTSVRERDDEIVRGYEHVYAPTSRAPKAMPHHTYFSTPSTSFNAASSTGGEDRGELKRKKTALIFPGQGSQYVAMCRDIYRSFRSARSVWHLAEEALISPVNPTHEEDSVNRHTSLGYLPGSGQERAVNEQQRRTFEEELAKSHVWDEKRQRRGRRGWLRDAVFFGDQLDLTRAENAQPSILVATLSILAVLRKEFSFDLIKSQVGYAAGHGSGTYAALVGSGSLDMIDAVRLLRHRGLISSQHVYNHPTLFPPGCTRPESMYETWAFANAGSGKGVELLNTNEEFARNIGGVPPLTSSTDGEVAQQELQRQRFPNVSHTAHQQQRGWKRTQMSGVMVRPGMLNPALDVVRGVQDDIRHRQIPGVAPDEVVEVANINSSLQIVLSGTRVGVSVACDRLRNENLGARAVNLPVSGPYHSSLMEGAKLGPALENLPLRDPDPALKLVSSVDGSILNTSTDIRKDLTGALSKPVKWLDTVTQLRHQGVERFICLGPGRACAHLLSKELGYRDRIDRAKKRAGAGAEAKEKEYEVWSIATVEDIETFVGLMDKMPK